MTSPISLASVRNERALRDSTELREELLEKCNGAFSELGGELAGYAVVVWDTNGDLRSAYNAAKGPIGPALVPTLVSDALNRHVAVMLARDEVEDGTSAF